MAGKNYLQQHLLIPKKPGMWLSDYARLWSDDWTLSFLMYVLYALTNSPFLRNGPLGQLGFGHFARKQIIGESDNSLD
jgi:hypothetical protein